MCTIQVLITILMCLTAVSQILLKHPECRPSTNCRQSQLSGGNGFVYYVNGTNRIKEQQVNVEYDENKKSYLMSCKSNSYVGLAADDPALPAMTNLETVNKMEFNGCIVPNISYASVLASLNIRFSSSNNGVLYLTELPAEPQLEGYHLKGLLIKELLITAADAVRPTRPKSDFLEHLPELKVLNLKKYVEPEKEAITHLPESLVELSLGITHLTLDDGSRNSSFWLTRLNSSLKSLTLQEVESPTGLVITLPQFALLPKLSKVELYNVPLPLSDSTTWLRDSKLQSLKLDNCTLGELPKGLFEGADIAEIMLKNNKLESLNGAFNPLQSSLRVLNLSDNNLKGGELINAVVALNKLETLIVNNNRLNSLCGSEGHIRTSLSSNLPKTLRHLELKNTSATSICDDWIEYSSLVYLNLDDNNIKNLWYNDLEMRRLKNVTVTLSLKNNPLQIRNITQYHYNKCIKDSLSKNRGGYVRVPVALTMDLSVCDCNVYWLREMLRHNNCPLLKADRLTCPTTSGRTSLFDIHTENLTCRYLGLCPDECSCDKRPKDNAIVAWCSRALPPAPHWPQEYPLALHFKPGLLDRVPHLEFIELHAPNNNITNLDGRDLPKTLRVLDVRNNSIAHITLDAAQRLLRLSNNEDYNVSLAGNPLACGCEDETAIATLQRAKIWDWKTTQCADHQDIMGKTKLCQDMTLWLLLGVMVAVFILMLILICLRTRIRQWFFDHNCCLRFWFTFKDDADDPSKTRDVFISYSFNDREDAKELIEKLEAHGLSTIEHCRDWLPGRTISQQITDSVLSARRTLLLVSDNYANSQWGLEEFHAAHAHAMERGSACVIVIRCNLLAPDKLPKELQLYFRNNTYLDRSDRYFWKKLLQVMPTPRAPQQAPVLLHDKMVQDPTSFQLVPSGTAPVGSRVSLDKELPLSELVLVVPVQQHNRGSQQSPGQVSPVTPVVREPPQPAEVNSPLPLDTQRQSLGHSRCPPFCEARATYIGISEIAVS